MQKIAVLGHGVVGSGVCEILTEKKDSLQKQAGKEIELGYVLVRRDYENVSYSNLFIKNYDIILNDPEVSVVAEVMGGIEPAFTYSKQALERGKNVVTSNKELVAEKGAELLALARKNNVNFMFEASVAGAIPVIRPLHQCLAANEIQSITGILNGTTNFILTKMIKEKSTFEDALKLAQELGYAESNPTADVEGLDACRKICILASLAYGKQISPNDVTCEGITKITPEDVAYATSWGGVIKLIGSANLRSDNKIDILVAPRFVSLHSRLAGVDDVFNAISVIGDCTGEVVFYGKGAGKMPTGSAVVADIIDCVVKTENIASLYWEESKEPIVSDPFKIVCMMYVRLKYDEVVQLKELQELFSPYRELQRPNQPDDEIAFITPFDTVADHMRKLRFLQIHGVELLGAIRILN